MGILGGRSIWQKGVNCTRSGHDVTVGRMGGMDIRFDGGGSRGVDRVAIRVWSILENCLRVNLTGRVARVDNRDWSFGRIRSSAFPVRKSHQRQPNDHGDPGLTFAPCDLGRNSAHQSSTRTGAGLWTPDRRVRQR